MEEIIKDMEDKKEKDGKDACKNCSDVVDTASPGYFDLVTKWVRSWEE